MIGLDNLKRSMYGDLLHLPLLTVIIMHFLRDCKQITSSFVVFSLSKKKWYIFSSFLEKAHAKLIDSVLWLVHILQAKCKLG